MSLVNRLLRYTLTALALVLAGFSIALYLLADFHLHQQAEERLTAAGSTLIASMDIEPDNVEWEPDERMLMLGPLGEQVYWLITDAHGQVVDRSSTLAAKQLAAIIRPFDFLKPTLSSVRTEGNWLLVEQRVQPTSATDTSIRRERTSEEVLKGEYPALGITLAISSEPVNSALTTLGFWLAGLSLGIWLLAFAGGRYLCRSALRPVTEMADAARAILPGDLGKRLPSDFEDGQLRDLSHAFNDLLDRLQESFERQQQFTGDASHQLRTPVSIIQGHVEVALRRPRSGEEYQQVLGVVHEQTDRLKAIVDNLLFLARADSGAPLPNLEPIDLVAWISERISSWKNHSRANDLNLDLPANDSLTIFAQEPILTEILSNLIDNAFKYSQPGTPITLRLKRQYEYAALAVEDQGIGIPSDDLGQLFQPFFRTENARRHGATGVGLGLAVASKLAQAFGGQIVVDSQVGQGSCFTVLLPALAANPQSLQVGAAI